MGNEAKNEEDTPMEDIREASIPRPTASVQLANILVLIEKAVRAKDTKVLVSRLLRQTAAIRPHLQGDLLTTFIEEALPADHQTRLALTKSISQVYDFPDCATLTFYLHFDEDGLLLLGWHADQEFGKADGSSPL